MVLKKENSLVVKIDFRRGAVYTGKILLKFVDPESLHERENTLYAQIGGFVSEYSLL